MRSMVGVVISGHVTLASIENRLRKIETARFQPDGALAALSDDEFVNALRAASDDPTDHAFAGWFQNG